MFEDSAFMSGAEKLQVYNAWRKFVASGYKRTRFTKALYKFLHMQPGFIAHFDINNFYAARFEDPKGRAYTLANLVVCAQREGAMELLCCMVFATDVDAEKERAATQTKVAQLDRLLTLIREYNSEHGTAYTINFGDAK